MPRYYRVAARQYARDVSGEGARLYGGRWTPIGYPAVYTAEHPALAGFELLVHAQISIEDTPLGYELVAIDVPAAASIRRIASVPDDPLAVGRAWLDDGVDLILAVPSVVVPASTNYLLNPQHALIEQVSVTPIGAFVLDQRITRQ